MCFNDNCLALNQRHQDQSVFKDALDKMSLLIPIDLAQHHWHYRGLETATFLMNYHNSFIIRLPRHVKNKNLPEHERYVVK